MTNELPAEIADARDMAATALSNLEAAEAESAATLAEFRAVSAKLDATDNALALAAKAEADARAAYVDTLRRHGYVQTADGPRRAVLGDHCGQCFAADCDGNHAPAEVIETITITPHPAVRAAILEAAGLEDQAPAGPAIPPRDYSSNGPCA